MNCDEEFQQLEQKGLQTQALYEKRLKFIDDLWRECKRLKLVENKTEKTIICKEKSIKSLNDKEILKKLSQQKFFIGKNRRKKICLNQSGDL